jgi:hypothetical protein
MNDGQKAQDCIAMFSSTMENLNKLHQEQMNGLINIVITIAETLRAFSLSPPEGQLKHAAGNTRDELGAFVDQLRGEAETAAESQMGQAAKTATPETEVAQSDNFCGKVEAAIVMAMENSVAQQQQMYIIAQAVLALGAQRLLSIPASKDSVVPGTPVSM